MFHRAVRITTAQKIQDFWSILLRAYTYAKLEGVFAYLVWELKCRVNALLVLGTIAQQILSYR